jgi:chloramphenicol 3-O-phosphotransferase
MATADARARADRSSGELVKLMESLHRGATYRVRTVWGPTDPFEQKCGMLQGNTLSCLMFDAFIDPLFCRLAAPARGFSFGRGVSVSILAYADDLTAIRNTVADAQAALEQCVQFFDAVSISINAMHQNRVRQHPREGPAADLEPG